jgi:hypothetical protein
MACGEIVSEPREPVGAPRRQQQIDALDRPLLGKGRADTRTGPSD